jgi:hypothetical protein
MPNAFFSGYPPSESLTLQEIEVDKVEVEPRTPAEYALHAVFIRFATAAEHKIGTFLKQPLVGHISYRLELSFYLHSRTRNLPYLIIWVPALTQNLITSSRPSAA